MRVGVIGGGVVGLSTAWYLRKLGAHPVVIESWQLGGGCSFGNAGWICPSISTPLPAAGLTLKSLLWMMRRDSPLYIRPRAAPALAPWLLRFRSHCNHADHSRGIAALAALNAVTMERYDELVADGVEFEMNRSDILMVFRDSATAAETRAEVEAVAAVGATRYREVDATELYEREPLLRSGFQGGILVQGERSVRPDTLTAGLGAALRRAGTEIHEGALVTGFRSAGRRVRAVVTSRGDLAVDAVVLAAGTHSGTLSRALGSPIPLTAGKGYSVTIDRPARQLRQMLYLAGAKINLTPYAGALRFSGTMELSGINRRLKSSRVESLRRQVSRAVRVPEAAAGGRAWVGMRPMTPDTLPVIGALPSRENAYANTGHQMLGITLGPSSGWALAGLVAEGRPGAALGAFSPGRWQRGR